MRVLITGGAGYIGTELTQVLAKRPDVKKVVVYDNLSRPNYNLFLGEKKLSKEKVRFVEGELLDSRKLKQILEEVDVVYHLAAIVTTPFANHNAHLFEQVNHWGTAELVSAAEERSIEKFIYMSSVSVYGSSEKEVDIETPPNPGTFYGISKLRGERHVERLVPKMDTVILRCGNVYGYSKSMRFDAVINQFMFNAHHKRRITIHGSGDQHRSFIHIDKVTATLEHLLKNQPKAPIFNLSDRTLSVNEITDVMKELYPDLETIFASQHMTMTGLRVKRDPILDDIPGLPKTSFREELEGFQRGFTIGQTSSPI